MVMDTLVYHISSPEVLPQPDVEMENGMAVSERIVMMETLLMVMDAPSLANARAVFQRVMELVSQAMVLQETELPSQLEVSFPLDL